MDFRILPVGDEALVVEFGTEIENSINGKVHALAKFIREQKINGIRELLPTFRSLMIFYYPEIISYKKLIKKIKHFEDSGEKESSLRKKILCVPCCYGSKFGLDLMAMAKRLNLSDKEIVQIHSGVDYKIYMLGFLPGFTYLGGLDQRIHIPRLETPRTAIPARSVGIGGNQTGVYPVESPGGWWLIGSTPIDFYNPKEKNPVLCSAGEYIRFLPVSESDYIAIRNDVEHGRYRPLYVYE